MRWQVRRSHEETEDRLRKKQSLLYLQLLETGRTHHAGSHGEDTRVVRRQMTGVRGVLRPRPLLGFPQDGQGRARVAL